MSNTSKLNRRRFLAAAATSSLPTSILRGQTREKLQVAFIGCGGQMQGHVRNVVQAGHEAVAFCDVDANRINESRRTAGEAWVKARGYEDYRKLLDQEKSVNAVVIASPDHWHSLLCTAAIQAGKHVYCEKPLTRTLAEARALRELSKKAKVITQMGNQGSASDNLRRSMELIAAKFFGEITEVHVWHPAHSWPSGVDRPAGEDPVPAGLNWDLWLGPSPARPYKQGIYHPGQWRGWYDFGGGSLADFCCHGFNLPLRALKLEYPTKIRIKGTELGKESFAKSCTVRYSFAARGDMAPVEMSFYSGGDMPPEDLTQGLAATFGKVPTTGCLFVGQKGLLSAGLWNNECYIRLKDDAKFVGAGNHEGAKAIPKSLPRVHDHLQEWADACLGGPKPFADFDIGGHITEIGLAGIVALRLQRDIDWDGLNMKVPGAPEADSLIRQESRTGFKA